MATCNDVAKLSGVSRQTVSRVINNSDNVSAETREKVLKAIEQLNYYPNTAARSLKSTKSKSIGMIIPDARNDFYIKIANLLQQKLSKLNYNLLILFSDENDLSEQNCLSTLIEHRIEVLLFSPIGVNRKFLDLLNIYNIKTVQLFRYLYSTFTSVTFDDEYGTYIAANYLLDRGHKKILLIEEMHTFESPRLNGLKRALTERGVVFTEDMYLSLEKREKEGIADIKNAIAASKPTAIIPVAKFLEILSLKALSELKMEVNRDISAVFYDDNETAELLNITALSHNFEAISDKIVEIIESYISEDYSIQHIKMKPFIIERP